MDGDFDYSGLSPQQLTEALQTIDRERRPRDYANLLAELERRAIGSSAAAAASSASRVRFLKGSPVDGYAELQGDCELMIGAEAVEIRGRGRRLFRRARDVTIRIPLAGIMNVAHADTQVHFDVVAAGEKAKRLVFWAATPAQAEQIAARLPARQTDEFRTALAEFRDFRQRLLSVSPTARVTPILIGLNVVVFLAMAVAGAGVFDLDPEVHVRWGSNFGPRTIGGEWWRLGTSTFVHFGLIHLLLNMWVLRLYGELAERLYGSVHFLALYLLAGIAGSLTSIWWHPEVNSAGASGAIFGVFGGLLAFVAQRKNGVPASIMIAHRNSMLLFLGYNLLFGFIHPGIDNAAHLGGLVSGFLLGTGLARPVDAAYRKEHRATALVFVVIAAAAVLAVAALSVARIKVAQLEDLQLRRDLAWFDQQERATAAAYDALTAQRRRQEITTRDFLERMEDEALPFWEEAAQRFANEPLNSASRHAELRGVLRDYVLSRGRMVRSVLTAYRLEGEEFEAAHAEFEKGNSLVPTLRRLRESLETQ